MMRSDSLYYACFLFPMISVNLHPILRAGQLCERRRFNDVDIFQPKDSVEIYHRHNEWVRKMVPKDRLLEFNPADGWDPLCEFLGVPVPREAKGEVIEYPRTNNSAQYRQGYWILMAMGLLSWTLLFGAIYGLMRYLVIPVWSAQRKENHLA